MQKLGANPLFQSQPCRESALNALQHLVDFLLPQNTVSVCETRVILLD